MPPSRWNASVFHLDGKPESALGFSNRGIQCPLQRSEKKDWGLCPESLKKRFDGLSSAVLAGEGL